MIKKTLFFSNPAYLSLSLGQLIIEYPDSSTSKKVPIEDIGIVIIESPRITITHPLLQALSSNGCVVTFCDDHYMPSAMLLPIYAHTEFTERFRTQCDASQPLLKNLWKQTVAAKIENQALHLVEVGLDADIMFRWSKEVTSGDILNHESRAAVYYWKHIFNILTFTRDRDGQAPNHLLNYGYAILRSVTARALMGSGLHPTLGIHHRNKYNPYCLADDIMEPYRPYVDMVVAEIVRNENDYSSLSFAIKEQLLSIPTMNVVIEGKKRPLLIAMSTTTSSLWECYKGSRKKITYPILS